MFICTGDRQICSYFRNLSGTLPPFSASFTMTCLWSQIFIDAELFLSPVMKLLGKLFARPKARVEIEKLHQIDHRLLPVELLFIVGRELGEDGGDVDGCRRRGARSGTRLRGCRGRTSPRERGWRRVRRPPVPGAGGAAWPKIVEMMLPSNSWNLLPSVPAFQDQFFEGDPPVFHGQAAGAGVARTRGERDNSLTRKQGGGKLL